MPFKSQAQRGKFYAMAERGEISPKVVSEWEHATPKGKKLPKHVKKSQIELAIKLARDMPHFTDQDRPDKVKEIYGALKREHPGMPAEMKARIAARQGKKGKQHQGPPYRGPLAKESHMSQTSVHERLRHYLVTGQPLEKSSAVRAELASILKSAGVERGAARVAARAKPAKGVLERAGKSIGKTYDTAKKKVSKNVGKVKKTVGEGYDVAKKKVGEGYEAAKEQGSRVGGFVKRHPYATGLAALGTAGVGGAGYALGSRNNSQKEAQLGTAFTDGFLHYCLENELSGDQVATMLEKGASLPGQVGNECRGLVDRMLNA